MIYVISCNIQYISYISIYPNDLSTIPLLADPSTAFHKTSPIRPPIKRFRILCRFSWCLSLGRSNFYNSHFAGEKHVCFFLIGLSINKNTFPKAWCGYQSIVPSHFIPSYFNNQLLMLAWCQEQTITGWVEQDMFWVVFMLPHLAHSIAKHCSDLSFTIWVWS